MSKVTKRVKELHEQNNQKRYEIPVHIILDFYVRCRDTRSDILVLLGGWSHLPNCSVKYRNEKLHRYNFGFLV